jgi:hypothetical protein
VGYTKIVQTGWPFVLKQLQGTIPDGDLLPLAPRRLHPIQKW